MVLRSQPVMLENLLKPIVMTNFSFWNNGILEKSTAEIKKNARAAALNV